MIFTYLKKILALDAQISSVLILRIWQIFAGLGLVVLVPLFLSKSEQGYFYTFSSILALQILFELGMSQVIVQFASHEFAHMRLNEKGYFEGDITRINRLSSLFLLICRWYRILALLFLLLVGVGGGIFFSLKSELPYGGWVYAWGLLITSSSINLYSVGFFTLVEGCGRLSVVARYRLLQSIAGNLIMWGLLVLGAGLFAIVSLPLVTSVTNLYFIKRKEKILQVLRGISIRGDKGGRESDLNWMKEILPFQWRVVASSLGGFLIFHAFTPIAFNRLGATEAGRLGISMALFNSILTVSMSWIYAKTPDLAASISQGNNLKLINIFKTIFRRALIFTVASCSLLIILLFILTLWDVTGEFSRRFAPVSVLVLLGVTAVANSIIFSYAAFMRAHKKEPLLISSLFVGLLTILAVVFTVDEGLVPMMFANMCITLFVALPWTTMLFKTYWKSYQ